MPAAVARSAEAEGLFTGPVLHWLREHGCHGVLALDGEGDVQATPDWVTRPLGRYGEAVGGWRFGWHGDDGQARHVLLAFADAGALPEAARRDLAGYLALAGRCAGSVVGAAHLIDRDAAAVRLHDLRNGLNSLLMNAAVMTTKLPADARDGRFARQVQDDGERCAALLQQFADSLRPPDAPRRG